MLKPTLATISLLLLASCSSESTAPTVLNETVGAPAFGINSGNAIVHSVNAGGLVDYSMVPGYEGYGPETYGFTASRNGDGNVSGQFESHWNFFGKRPSELRFHMEITCLSVSGNEAWLGGVVTQSSVEWFPVGIEWVWRVVDNGEGNNAPPDQLGMFFFQSASTCADGGDPQSPDLYDWTHGNVEVK